MTTSAVILAAGSSRRMGSPKQLLLIDGRPLLERVVAETNASRVDGVLVVLGASATEIQQRVNFGRAEVLINPDHASGMASSLRAGLLALPEKVDRALIVLGDQPAITAKMLDELLDLQESSGLPAAALDFDGLLHPPVVLKRELWGDLMSLEGDVGCRAVIRARPELVARLSAHSDRGNHPIDVDTPADYDHLVRAGRGGASSMGEGA